MFALLTAAWVGLLAFFAGWIVRGTLERIRKRRELELEPTTLADVEDGRSE